MESYQNNIIGNSSGKKKQRTCILALPGIFFFCLVSGLLKMQMNLNVSKNRKQIHTYEQIESLTSYISISWLLIDINNGKKDSKNHENVEFKITFEHWSRRPVRHVLSDKTED